MVFKSFIQSSVFLSIFLLVLAQEALGQAPANKEPLFPPKSRYQLLGVEHFSTDVWKYGFRRDPYQPEYTEDWTYGGQFNFDWRALYLFRWKNHIHVDGTDSQLRNAGWEWELTTDYYYRIRPFYYHHSEHALDTEGSQKRFPIIDRYGFNICWLGCQ